MTSWRIGHETMEYGQLLQNLFLTVSCAVQHQSRWQYICVSPVGGCSGCMPSALQKCWARQVVPAVRGVQRSGVLVTDSRYASLF